MRFSKTFAALAKDAVIGLPAEETGQHDCCATCVASDWKKIAQRLINAARLNRTGDPAPVKIYGGLANEKKLEPP